MTRSTPLQQAAAWLTDRLQGGEMPVSAIVKEAEESGIARATLYRAANSLPTIKCRHAGWPMRAWWSLETADTPGRSDSEAETPDARDKTPAYQPQPGAELLQPLSPDALRHRLVMLGVRV